MHRPLTRAALVSASPMLRLFHVALARARRDAAADATAQTRAPAAHAAR